MQWQLAFECPEASELKILTTDTNYNLIQKTSASFLMGENTLSTSYDKTYANPFTFAIGVIAPEEGCYQNYLGMYMRPVNDPDLAFFMGLIVIKTEVIQEDTRYRTLLGNFGIPDPINYSNIFAEANYNESLSDYELINRKSKELMLTYDQIFPFAGTYKGLINALKFLGYTDIIMKEWYKIFDNNYCERDVAIDSIDIQNGLLGQMLDKYQTAETRKYTKLDYISMVYHLNQIIDSNEPEQQEYWKYTPGSDVELDRSNPFYSYFEVPGTKPIYAYRTDEITAKLYAVKRWLETYIIGVSARIINITGEGVYFAPMKSQIYNTGGMVQDFYAEEHITPVLSEPTPFIKSQSEIGCTIREFDGLTFGDIGARTFEAYTQNQLPNISKIISGTINKIDGSQMSIMHMIDFPVLLSNPIATPTLGTEYSFELTVSPESMSLDPWMNSETSVIIEDDVMRLSSGSTAEICTVGPGQENNKLPVFIIETGNLRKPTGVWEKNVEWMIQERVDNDTMESVYVLQNIGSFAFAAPVVNSISHIILKPIAPDARCQYSAENKWGVPMIMIKGYQFDLQDYKDADGIMSSDDISKWFKLPEDVWYVLEIVTGRMMQDKSNGTETINGKPVNMNMSYEVMFDTEYSHMNESYMQKIQPTVTYTGDRIAIKGFDHYDYKQAAKGILSLFGDQAYEMSEYYIINFIISNVQFAGMDKHYLDYINTSHNGDSAIDVFAHWLMNRELKRIEGQIITETLNQLYEHITLNMDAAIPVHHLGTYTGTVKMYDCYNNIYVNNTSKTVSVVAKPYDISLVLNQENSNNTGAFYDTNIKGEEIMDTKTGIQVIGGHKIPVQRPVHKPLNSLLPISTYNIKFPTYYDLYDIQNNELSYNNLYFWNYSYANLTPQAGDQLQLSNRFARVYLKSVTSDTIENLCVVGLYDYAEQAQTAFQPGDTVRIYKYDDKYADMVTKTDKFITSDYITAKICSIPEPDAYNEPEWIYAEKLIEISTVTPLTWPTPPDSGIRYYMINVSEYDVQVDNIESTNNWMDTFVISDSTSVRHFNTGNIIKVTYDISEHPYDTRTVNYGVTKNLYNALYDAAYPALYIKYADGTIQEHQYNILKADDPKRNIDVTLKQHYMNIRECLLVYYQYDPETWHAYTLLDYLRINANSDVISYEIIKELLTRPEGSIWISEPSIKYTTHAEFDRYDNIVSFKFGQSNIIKNHLHNSVSYRILNITETKRLVQNKGM